MDSSKLRKPQTRPIRLLRRDGNLNLHKDVLQSFRLFDHLINISWQRFLLYGLLAFIVINLIFTILYWFAGGSHCIADSSKASSGYAFLDLYFFSTQTFTTVGYGHLHPTCVASSVLASFEAFTGLIFFAVITGLFYTKFTNSRVEVLMSQMAVIDEFANGYGFKFMMANEFENKLVDVQVTLDLIKLEIVNGRYRKRFYKMALLRDTIPFLSVPWTVVHPIDEKSPLWGISRQEFEESSMEFFVQVKVFDESHRQVLFKEFSYFGKEEVLWGQKFVNIQRYTETGALKISMSRFGKTSELKDFPDVLPTHGIETG
jgi:inward rectifier potassium channel